MARIPEFYKLSVSQRVREFRQAGPCFELRITRAVAASTPSIQSATSMIENVIGVMGLPLALVPESS